MEILHETHNRAEPHERHESMKGMKGGKRGKRGKRMMSRTTVGNSNKFQGDPRTIVGARLPAKASVQARMCR